MKKTLVALVVSAVAASSAQALTVYNQNGTDLNFYGSLRVTASNHSGNDAWNNAATGNNKVGKLANDGSRFGVIAKHDLGNDLYAVGRLELRFKDTGNDNFGDVYAKRAYVGLGTKSGHQVTFGRQVTIADDLAQTDFDRSLTVAPSAYVTTSGNSVVRYDYTGVKNLQVSANYNFSEDGSNNLKGIKNGYGVGAIYTLPLAQSEAVTFTAGYTRDNLNTQVANTTNRKDAYLVSALYQFGATQVAADFAQRFGKDNTSATHSRDIAGTVAVKHNFTDKAAAYVGYNLSKMTTQKAANAPVKIKQQRVLLGTEYQFNKYVLAFAEGRFTNQKPEALVSGEVKGLDARRNLEGALGMRVNW